MGYCEEEWVLKLRELITARKAAVTLDEQIESVGGYMHIFLTLHPALGKRLK